MAQRTTIQAAPVAEGEQRIVERIDDVSATTLDLVVGDDGRPYAVRLTASRLRYRGGEPEIFFLPIHDFDDVVTAADLADPLRVVVRNWGK